MKLRGVSIAGVETCIEAPELKLLLDVGRCTRTAVAQPLVLVSHGHLDHIGAIAHHAALRAMMKMGESTYVVPRAVAPAVEKLFNAAGELDGQPIARRVVPLGEGDEFSLGKHRWVRPFGTFHRVPSQGYTVWERRYRLREEFRSMPGHTLGALRREGVEIEEAKDVPVLSFTGDTRVDVLECTPELQAVETLVIEASFLDQAVSVREAREMGHVHLDELVERHELLSAAEVVLTHFSARYGKTDIERILAERLPPGLSDKARILGGRLEE